MGEGELRAETGPAGTGSQGHGHGGSAGDRVGGELLADAPDGATTLWDRDRRGGERLILRRIPIRLLLCHEFVPQLAGAVQWS